MRPLLDLMADPESGMVDKTAYVLHSLVGSKWGSEEITGLASEGRR